MITVSRLLPGLSCSLTWSPSDNMISFSYNSTERYFIKMPDTFTSLDYKRALDIAKHWREWRSRRYRFDFSPDELGIADAETAVEAVRLFLHSF